ncbi:G-alpha-domain-containing protein [Thelephora ganbajun]|uniref:G-alpha-domain-containing protein n=1 Tax=Thelephora ganbajun TaxID=370292 RepID=A0ACB6Z6T0_THEGA|nr:G-alpha-domain-containing protein [Thelephora ganbajun]
MGRSFDENVDPLAQITAPPVNETPDQRRTRECKEAEARKISEQIDEALKAEREEGKAKRKNRLKILLLGQSESGKSTTVKNFQLKYAPRAWKQERLVWTTVVQLNLIKNVNSILDVLNHEMAIQTTTKVDSISNIVPAIDEQFSEKHKILKLRLAPLRGVQTDLERKLGNGRAQSASAVSGTITPTESPPIDDDLQIRRLPKEFYIRSNNSWKDRFKSGLRNTGRPRSGGSVHNVLGTWGGDEKDVSLAEWGKINAELEGITGIIAGCREDIKTLWEDELVQRTLTKRKYRVDESSGFFLNDVDRIATKNYKPSDDDIVRARLRTLGVQEHKFVFEQGKHTGTEWHIYDVGGSRSSRASWASFFDDMDAIIFLAPLSVFDEKLLEDNRVNRLQDSYELWKQVTSNKVLAGTQIILFLNKYDLLAKKLKRGVKVRDFISSYGERESTPEAAVKYFEAHFKEVHRKHSHPDRAFFVHLTSVVDTKATTVTLSVVEDSILRRHLVNAQLL